MKVVKKITVFLLIFAMLASFMPYSVLAEETLGSDGAYEWIDNGSTISITNYIGSETNVTIPSELSGKPVTEIQGGAFSEKSVVNVTIPDSVTNIGQNAFFASASLQSVQLPDSINDINGETFRGCTSLQSIVIPNSVTNISFAAFKDCSSLSSVTFSNTLQSIGQRAFMGCTSLGSISLPLSVQGVGPDVFSDCTSLQSVYIYNPAMDFDTSEDENVFDNAPLTNGIYGYESSTAETYATSIGKTFHALYTVTFNSNGGSSVSSMIKTDGSKITKPTDPTKTNYSFEGWYTDNETFADVWDFAADTVTVDVTLFAKWHENGTPYSNGTYEWDINEDNISVRITKYIGLDTTVTIPSTLGGKSVTNIAGESFIGNTTIQSVVIPDSVTQIGFTAFKNCTSLSSVTLSDALEYIGQSAFEGCTSLSTISFPASMIGAGNDSFKGCTSLSHVYVYSDDMGFGELGENNNIFDGAQILYGIFAYEDSTGQTFAETFEYPFHALYTVGFDTNGGGDIDNIIIATGSTISRPADPQKDDYTFQGWYTDDDTFADEWDFDHDIVTSDIILHAKWVAASYVVSFESNGGGTVDSVNANYNTTITAPAAPAKTGYTFAGWYKEEALTNAWDFENDKVTQTITLYAKWNCIVTFNSNGGSAVDAMTAEYNKTIIEPKAPVKDSKIFEGWYTDNNTFENAWDFAYDNVTQNITLYAKWIDRNYTVTFNSNGGNKVAPINSITYGSKITQPANPTMSGYIFKGWYLDDTYYYQWNFSEYRISGNTTLYARWLKVGYNENDYLKMQRFLNSPSTWEGHSNGMLLNDYYDQNNPDTWTITWSTASPKRIEQVVFPSGYNKAYHLSGTIDISNFSSLTNFNCNYHEVSSIDASNCTLLELLDCYSNNLIELNINNCTSLTQLNCGGNELTEFDLSTNIALSSLSCYSNDLEALDLSNNINLYTIQCQDNQLASLDISTNNNKLEYISSSGNPFKHIKLKVLNNVKDIYVIGNGYIYLTANSADYGSQSYVYAAPYSGSSVKNWVDGTTANPPGSQYMLGNITSSTLTAVFTTSAVSFESNGGSYVSNINANYDTTITKPTDPTKSGSVFMGWYKEPEFINQWNFATDKVTDNITIYAKWDKNNVTFDSWGGSEVEGINGVPYGSTIAKPANPTMEDCTFAGWYDVNYEPWDFDTDVVTKDITLYADWEYDTCNISAVSNNTSYGTVYGSGTYLKNSSAVIIAEPKAGYLFLKWTEGGREISNDTVYMLNATSNRNLTAVFASNQAPVLTSAVSSSYKSILLNWNAVTNSSGYEIWRSTSSTSGFAKIAQTDSAGYTDDNLTTGINYYYEIRAFYTIGPNTVYSPYSAVKYAKPIPATPNITVSQTSYNSLTISWNAIEGATGYKVYRSTSASGTYTALTPTTSTSLISTGLATGTTYYYKVLAYRTEGSVITNSAYSAVKSAKPIPTTPIATAVSAGYNSVKVFWNIVPGATGYTVYRSSSATEGFASIATVTSTTYTHASLAMGTTYYYKVAAYRTVGTTKVYGLQSEATSAVPIPSTPAPTAVSTGYTSIKVSWPAVSGATGYKIYKTDENGQVLSTLAENLTSPLYTQDELTTNQMYYYKVVAFRTVSGIETLSSDSAIVSAKPVPSAPTGLTAASAGYNSTNLSWNEVAGAEGYALMRSTSLNGLYIRINSGTFISCTDNNLTTGTTYYYKVYAYINGTPDEIKGDDSVTVSVKPIPATPVITVTPTQYNSLSISWEAIAGASGYKVYRSTSKTGTYAYVAPVTAGTSYTNTGLATGTTYYYKVLAYTTEGSVTTNSLYSAYKYAKVIPSAPIATAASYNYNSLKISWPKVSGASGYTIYRCATETGTYAALITTTSNSYVNTSLVTGGTYYYKVIAYRLVGTTKVYSAYSAITSAKVIPAAPVVKADNYSYTSNIITWSAISGATGYEVYLTDITGTDETLLSDNTANNKINYTHSSLTTNQTYYYKVKAYRTVGANKVYSNFSAVVSSKPIPTAPTASVLLNTYNSLNIKWNKIDGADKYEIRRSNSSTGSFEKVGEADSDATNYIDTSLTTSSTYYYKVVAVVGTDVYGDESAVVSAKVLPAAPVVTVSPTAYNSLSLSWNSQDGVTGYRIYRSTSKTGTYTLIKTITDGSTSFVNTGLAAGTTYYYKLIAYRTDGAVTTLSPYSAVKSAKVIPAAPTGVSAASASYNSIKVTWDKVSGASGYTVYRATSETGTYTTLATITTNIYTSTALTTGTTYYYKVAAYRLAGTTKVYGTASDITSAYPKPAIPAPSAQSAGYTSVKITWPIALGASGYEIYQTDENGEITKTLDENVTAVTYTDTGLTTNQTYYYKVKSYKTTTSGKVYGDFSVVVNAIPIPSTPVIKVTLNSYNSLNINWEAIDGADKYEVWRNTASTGDFTKIGESDTNSYLDSSLTTGATYYYQVRAYIEGTSNIYSNYSAAASLKVTPTTPIITVTPNTYNSLSISWEEVSGATGYMIYRATSSAGTYTRVYTAGAGETSYINSPLATGSTYYYKVLAFVTEGTVTTNSAYSAVKSAKVKPAAPTGAAAASASYTSIKITWNKVDGASGYTVYRLASNGTYPSIATVTGINSTTYTNTGLITGTTYTYKVAAYRLVGTTKVYGDYSEIVSAWPKPAAPAPTAVSAGYNSVLISWPAVGGASGYEIWDNAEHKIGETTTAVSYPINGLTAGTEYSYKVRAYKTAGTDRLYGDYSVVVSATPIPATPIITAVTPATYNSLNITWSAIAGADKYEILRSTSSTGSYTSIDSITDTIYEDKDLTIGGTYYYKVKAYIEGTPNNIYSLESAAKSATVVLPAPSSPAAETASATSINLTWSAVGGAEGYYIYRSTSATGTYNFVNATSLTNYTDTGRTTGTTYYYKLKSFTTIEGNAVTSAYSAVVSAKATLLAPILTATLGGYNSVDLKWNIISGAVGYTVYRSTSLNGSYVLIETVTGDNEYTDYDDLVENATYYYKVKAYLLVGSTKVYGNDSNVQSVTTKYLPDFDAIPPSTNLTNISYITIQVVNYGTLPLTIYNYIEDDAYIINDDFYTLTLVNESNNPIESIVISPGSTKNIRFKVDNPPVQYTLGDTIWFDFAYDGVSYWADTDYYYGTWYFPYQ